MEHKYKHKQQGTGALRHLTLLLSVAAMAGCAITGPRESPLPHDGPTMVDIYRTHMDSLTEGSDSAARERMPLRDAMEASPGENKRAAINQIDNRFPRLPNPDLVMVVLPHLAKGHYPIPGYVTVFPMYEKVEYAMPGEVATRKTTTGVRTTAQREDAAALSK